MAKTKTKSRDDGGSMKRVVRIRYASSFRYADVLELYVEDQAFRQAVDSGRYALAPALTDTKNPEAKFIKLKRIPLPGC